VVQWWGGEGNCSGYGRIQSGGTMAQGEFALLNEFDQSTSKMYCKTPARLISVFILPLRMAIYRIKKIYLYFVCLGILFALLVLPNFVFLIRSNLAKGEVAGTEEVFAGYYKNGTEKWETRVVIHFIDSEGKAWSFLGTPLASGYVGLEGSEVKVRYINGEKMDARIDHPGSIWRKSFIWGLPLFLIITTLFIHREFLPKVITLDLNAIEDKLFGKENIQR
jgi:hypothetical protein